MANEQQQPETEYLNYIKSPTRIIYYPSLFCNRITMFLAMHGHILNHGVTDLADTNYKSLQFVFVRSLIEPIRVNGDDCNSDQ